MKTFMKHRNGANQTRRSEKSAGPQGTTACAFEPLEARQLFSVTGFSLVDQSTFPGSWHHGHQPTHGLPEHASEFLAVADHRQNDDRRSNPQSGNCFQHPGG